MAEKQIGGGLGIASVLGIVFVVLKLTETIDWKWVWVLFPWWSSCCLSLILFGASVFFMIIIGNSAGNISVVDGHEAD